MSEFEVSFEKVLLDLARLTQDAQDLGKQFDRLESALGRQSSATKKLTSEMASGYNRVTEAVDKLGDEADEVTNSLRQAQNIASNSMMGMVTSAAQAEVKYRALRGELGSLGKTLQNTAAYNAASNTMLKLGNLTNDLANKTRLLQARREALKTAEGQMAAGQQVLLTGYQNLATAKTRQIMQNRQLTKAEELQATALGELNAQTQARISAMRSEQSESVRQTAELQKLQRQYISLNDGMAAHIVRQRELNRQRTKQILDDMRAANSVKALTEADAASAAASERTASALKAKNAMAMEVARSVHRMTMEEAQARVQAEALAAATKAHNAALMEEASKTLGISRAQKELTTARDREVAKLEQLRTQKEMLNGSYGRELAQIRKQIEAQQQLNRVSAMTTAELLGFGKAHKSLSISQAAGAQTAAMFRASLAGLGTSIGIYTGATVLAASATYAVSRALRSTVSTGMEFNATMTRADAIMSSGSGMDKLSDGAGALEMQVRALGMTTIYTASEVAEGLRELGMAGLSATEALIALQPALDLAMIGNLSMGQAADIATNIMQTFEMEAKDLTSVVDVMAMAITNSNTTVEQLANALSYAGPAAHTAGISLIETTAAIESLANSGIKASRAGTALRRLFVSLLNPTKKGAEMLAEYEIAVTNLDGSTRSLEDILKRMHEALNAEGVSEGERLSAIQDLVGVYATSPIAALLSQSGEDGNFGVFIRQLEMAQGAAEKFREKIEGTLKVDWAQVVSAFEETQLALFDSQEMRLRNAAASLTSWMLDLTEPLETLANGETITQLDVIIARIETIATSLAYAAGGFMSYKLLAGGMATALAADLGKAAPRLKELSDRMIVYTDTQRRAHQTISNVNTQAAIQNRTFTLLTGTTGTLAGSLGRMAGTMSSVIAIGGSLLGWVGLLGSIGYAFYNVFSSDANQAVRDQKTAIDELTESYERNKRAYEETARGKQERALDKQEEENQKQLAALQQRQSMLQDLLDSEIGLSETTLQAARDNLATVEMSLARLEESEEALRRSREALGSSPLDEMSLQEQIDSAIKAIFNYKEELRRVEDGTHRYIHEQEMLEASVRLATAGIESQQRALENLLGTMQEVQASAVGLFSQFTAEWDRLQQPLVEDRRFSALSNENQYLELVAQLEKVQAQAVQLDGNPDRFDTATAERLAAEAAEIQKKLIETADRIREDADARDAAAEALAHHLRTDVEKLQYLNAELAKMGDSPAAGSSLKEQEDWYKRRLQLLNQIGSLTKQEAKDSKSLSDALKEAGSVFDALHKKFDPVAVSLADVNKKKEQLRLLVEHNRISTEQYNRALFELEKAHLDVVLAQDKNRESLIRLKQEYTTSPFESTLQDMIELQRLYEAGAVSMQDYIRLSQQMRRENANDVLNGRPTVGFQLQGGASTPFSELGSTMIDVASGFSWYDTRSQEALAGSYQEGQAAWDTYDAEVEMLRMQYEGKQALAEEYNQKLIEAEEKKNRALRVSQEKLNQQSAALTESRKEYEVESSRLMMISIMGAAENMLGMFAAVGEEATAAQKLAFVAQKGLAVAQILMYAHLASARAPAEAGILGIPLGKALLAQGYASAGLVAALSIGQLAGGGSSGSSNYAGAYDKGGWIPAGKWGVVGEYGPEMVHGPAHVTGREKTSKMLGGGGDTFDITLAPVIHVTPPEKGGETSEEDAREFGYALKSAVVAAMQEQMRPNGVLDQWIRSVRRG